MVAVHVKRKSAVHCHSFCVLAENVADDTDRDVQIVRT